MCPAAPSRGLAALPCSAQAGNCAKEVCAQVVSDCKCEQHRAAWGAPAPCGGGEQRDGLGPACARSLLSIHEDRGRLGWQAALCTVQFPSACLCFNQISSKSAKLQQFPLTLISSTKAVCSSTQKWLCRCSPSATRAACWPRVLQREPCWVVIYY